MADLPDGDLARGVRPDARRDSELIATLRTQIVEHAAACYRRGRADALGLGSAQVVEQQAVRAALDQINETIVEIRKQITPSPPLADLLDALELHARDGEGREVDYTRAEILRQLGGAS